MGDLTPISERIRIFNKELKRPQKTIEWALKNRKKP